MNTEAPVSVPTESLIIKNVTPVEETRYGIALPDVGSAEALKLEDALSSLQGEQGEQRHFNNLVGILSAQRGAPLTYFVTPNGRICFQPCGIEAGVQRGFVFLDNDRDRCVEREGEAQLAKTVGVEQGCWDARAIIKIGYSTDGVLDFDPMVLYGRVMTGIARYHEDSDRTGDSMTVKLMNPNAFEAWLPQAMMRTLRKKTIIEVARVGEGDKLVSICVGITNGDFLSRSIRGLQLTDDRHIQGQWAHPDEEPHSMQIKIRAIPSSHWDHCKATDGKTPTDLRAMAVFDPEVTGVIQGVMNFICSELSNPQGNQDEDYDDSTE